MRAAWLGHLLLQSSTTFEFELETAGQRHSPELEAKGNHFTVTSDDKPGFGADDETFKDVGKPGVWTKADVVTPFDDLVLENADLK